MKSKQYVLALAIASGVPMASAASWEAALSGKDAAAQQRIRFLCTERASQRLYGKANGVQSVTVRVADSRVNASASFNSEASGVSYTNLPYMFLRLGLREIEFDAIYASGPAPGKQPVAVFDTKSRDTRFVGSHQAKMEILYSDAGTPQDEALGIFGRKIQVRLASTGQTLGERTEFFWFHGSNPRNRVRVTEALCPSFTLSHQSMPQYFIAEVVNPDSYRCMTNFVRGMTIAKQEMSRQFPKGNASTSARIAWSDQKQHREKALLNSLNRCEAEYFARPTPLEFSIEWNAQPQK